MQPSRIFDRFSIRLRSLRQYALALAVCLPASAVPCPPVKVAPLDLGNANLGFAEISPGTFSGGGIGGRVQLSASGLEIAQNAVDGAANAADLHLTMPGADLTFRIPGTGSADFASARATFIGPSGVEAEMSAYDQLEVNDVYPGLDLTVEASQRRVNLIFSGRPAAFEALSLSAEGAQAMRIDPASGALDIAMAVHEQAGRDAGKTRTSTVEMVALGADGRSLPAAFELNGDRVRIALETSDPNATLRVVLTTLYSPYVEPAATAGLASGGRLAVGTTRADGKSPRSRGFIAELDASGERVVRTTYLDLGTELTLDGVAVDRWGRTILAGRQQSKGPETIFLAAIDSKGRGFSVSPVFGSLVSGAAHSVTVADDGSIVLTGTAGDNYPSFDAQNARFTVAMPAGDTAASERLFVAAVEPDLNRLRFATELTVPATAHRLQAWIDCHGELMIGVPWGPKATITATHTYSMTIPSDDMATCPEIDRGWGDAAMCWKYQKNVGTYTYHPDNVDESKFPKLIVENPDPSSFDPDYKRLNQLEANAHGNLFFNTDTGQWSDPGGGWGAKDNWAYSREEIALAAAIYQERWTSPIFANFRLSDGGNPPTPLAVMLRAETFNADSSGDLPHNACDEDLDNDGHSDWSDDPWPLPPEHQVAAACESAHGSQFELISIDYDAWLGSSYTPDQSVDGNDPSWWPWVSPYVGDPPEPGDADQMTTAHVTEMTRRLRGSLRTTVDLVLTPVVDGVAQDSTTLCVQVASQDLAIQ